MGVAPFVLRSSLTAPLTAPCNDTTAFVLPSQAWEIEVIAAKAGIGGTDVVRFRLAGTTMCLAVSGPPGRSKIPLSNQESARGH